MNEQKRQQPSGFNCPVCKGFIPVSVQQLIITANLICPQCALEIRINKNESQKAIDALEKVHAAEKSVKEASVFNQ